MEGKGGIGVKEKPSKKSGVVECIDCHKGVVSKKKDTFDTIKKRCIECHDQSYGEMAIRWKATHEELLKRLAPKLAKVKEEIEKVEKRGRPYLRLQEALWRGGVQLPVGQEGRWDS